jgi:hypothetical protein
MPNWVKCGHVEPNEATECVTCVKNQRDRLRDMLNDIRGMAWQKAFTPDSDFAGRILRRIEDGTVEKQKPVAPGFCRCICHEVLKVTGDASGCGCCSYKA